MRELERDSTSGTPAFSLAALNRLAVVGRGRLGSALAAALSHAGYEVLGPLGRGADAAGAQAALVCVPDSEIPGAAQLIVPEAIVGHCSGATSLAALGSREGFSLHPLMTVTAEGARFAGAGCAIAGNTPRALALADTLARRLAMTPVHIDEADRPAYHAVASMASNFLVTLESAAEELAGQVGLERQLLTPLVSATTENWAAMGARALTGPIARGDEATVTRQRQAIAERAPELLELFDVLAAASRRLAASAKAVAQ